MIIIINFYLNSLPPLTKGSRHATGWEDEGCVLASSCISGDCIMDSSFTLRQKTGWDR